MIRRDHLQINHLQKKRYERETKKKEGFGAIINTTGKRIIFPRTMEKKYCSDFIDVAGTCRHGESCHFVHATYPGGFTENDRSLTKSIIEDTKGLSFKDKNAS